MLVIYVYAGYPAAALALALLHPRVVRKDNGEPFVTILIAAHNEARVIGKTIENKLALDYPSSKLEIIVISDGSHDDTDSIVQSFAEQGVQLIRQEPRAGKTSALNMAVPRASGEIICFSDANSMYAPDALKKLVANFGDPEVGYVTGKMIYTDPDGTPIGDGCSAYMKYENALRGIESAIGSVVGVDGGIDAMRKNLYRPMNADQLPDFVQPLKVVEQGYRVVYEPEALLWESSLKEAADEYRMRVRVSLRAFWALFDMRRLLVPWSGFLFAWQLWSHKVMRYLCFVFLACAFTSNMVLMVDAFVFQAVFALQCIIYFIAFAALWLEKYGFKYRIFVYTKYFFILNISAAHAFCKFVAGKKQIVWNPRKG